MLVFIFQLKFLSTLPTELVLPKINPGKSNSSVYLHISFTFKRINEDELRLYAVNSKI